MSDTKQTVPSSTHTGTKSRRPFVRRAVIVSLVIAGVAAGVGVKAFAQGGGHAGWHHAGFAGAPLDPATLEDRLDRILRHLYAEVDASDAQKQQLAPIVKDAARDLLPLRTQMHDARRQAVQLLSQEHVDRAALESLRADQLKLAEQASKRLTQALADIADVLTPAQKQALADHIGRRHGPRG